jgi:hypothetical protein
MLCANFYNHQLFAASLRLLLKPDHGRQHKSPIHDLLARSGSGATSQGKISTVSQNVHLCSSTNWASVTVDKPTGRMFSVNQ